VWTIKVLRNKKKKKQVWKYKQFLDDEVVRTSHLIFLVLSFNEYVLGYSVWAWMCSFISRLDILYKISSNSCKWVNFKRKINYNQKNKSLREWILDGCVMLLLLLNKLIYLWPKVFIHFGHLS